MNEPSDNQEPPASDKKSNKETFVEMDKRILKVQGRFATKRTNTETPAVEEKPVEPLPPAP